MSKQEDEVLRYIQGNVERFVPPDALRAQEVSRYVQEHSDRLTAFEEGPGFFSRHGKNLLDILAAMPRLTSGAATPEDMARLATAGAGIFEGAIVKPLEGAGGAFADISEYINNLPGLRELPLITIGGLPGEEGTVSAFRRIEEFARRAREGVITDVEMSAMSAGLSPGEVAAAKGFGEFVGFTAPLIASYKIASLLFQVPRASVLRFPLTTHLPVDFTAGAIFGSLFVPAEGFGQRVKHGLSDSAIFGVGRLILNGLVFPWTGVRSRRFHLMKESGRIDKMMEKIRNGEPLVLTQEEAPIVTLLLSEEEYVINSIGAQIFVERGNAEAALLQGIIDSSSAGSSSGIVRGLGLSFTEIGEATTKFRAQFPQLKFDVIKSVKGEGYNIVFGTQGLSNMQKRQMARTGRFQDLWVEKNGTNYLFVSEADFRKGDPRSWINVRTSDGKVTQIVDEGVTDLFTYQEQIKPNQILNRMFEDFSKAMDDEIAALTHEGIVTEGDLIRGIRDGIIVLEDGQRRAFNVAGAIVHPEELGLKVMGEGSVSHATFYKIGEDGGLRTGRLYKMGDFGESGPWGFVEHAENLSDPPKRMIELGSTLEEAVQRMEKGEWQFGNIRYMTARADETMAAIVKEGVEAGTVMPDQFPYITLEGAVDAWARKRGIPTDTPDFPAVKSYFASQYRDKMWRMIPDEDKKVFESIREEFFRLTETNEIPLTAQAWNKGIGLEEVEVGYALRDLRTGATITVESEGAAREALKNVHRPEKDMVETFMPFEGHGISGMTGGWEHPGQGLHFADHVDPAVFLGPKDAPLLMSIRNVRDLFMHIENKTKFPLFSQVFDEVDLGTSRMRVRLEPFANRIQEIWKDIPKRGNGSRYELVEWWSELEGSELGMVEAIKFLQGRGATSKQVQAYRKARELWDVGFELSGIEKGRFIHNYYSRVRPWVEQHGVAPDMEQIFGRGSVPPEFSFWAEMSRTGDLSMIEKDPELVMHRWFRSLFFKQEVGDAFNRARNLVINKTTPRIRDLPKDIQREVMASSPQATLDDPILPPQIRKILSEYLNIVRGTPEESVQGLRDFTTRFFRAMGIEADPRFMENFINIHLSNMYGAAMGLRPSIIARDATQTIWTMYTRLGGRQGSRALEKAMTHAGYEEPVAAGAIRSTTAGIPQGDAIFNQFIEEADLRGSGPVSSAIAASLRGLMRLGNVSSRVGRKTLIPYSSTDDVNRAWSYWWQKYHTEDFLLKFERGKISWDKFIEDGLPFYSGVTKNKFQKIYNTEGRERALRWIGKIAADETHWIYGVGAQPALLQRPVGKYVGMFGTWPLWAAELYFSRIWKGTPKQRAAFVIRNLSLVGAMSNMIVQTGYDLWSWIAPLSIFGWAGGPVVDYSINARAISTAPLDQKYRALGTLAKNVGRLTFPGQIFINDIRRSLDSDHVGEAGLKMFLGRPVDEYNFSLEVLYDPGNLQNRYMFGPPSPPQPPPVTRPGGTK